jgi:DNA repair exonuclease SbcCD nuclease subunit
MTMSDINIKQSKVAIFSDLHLGVHQDSIAWHETALSWCDWFVEELHSKKITDIFFLGDFFHYRSDISVSTLHVAAQILKKLEPFNMVFIVGNHDSYYKDRSDVNSLSILDGRKNLTIVDQPLQTTLFGKDITFIPWGAKVDDLKRADILFGHLEIASFKMNSFKTCDHGEDTNNLLSKADLIMTGHFHLRDERKYANGRIVYVGNPFEMDFGDTGSTKGYYILDIPNMSYDFVENTLSPRHKKVSLSELTAFKSLSGEDVKQLVNNSIIKLVIDKKAKEDGVEMLIKKMNAFNPFSFSVDYSLYNNSISVDDQNYEATGVDMQKTIEEFINVLDIENKNEIITYCFDLYKRASHT